MQITINTQKGPLKVPYNPSESLLEAIRHHTSIVAPCGGKGKCGKCIIKVESGDVTTSQADSNFLSRDDIKNGYRLACKAYAKSDCIISLGKSEENDFNITGAQIEKDIKIDPIVERYAVDISDVDWAREHSLVQSVYDQLGTSYPLSLHAMKQLSRLINAHNETGGQQDLCGTNKARVIVCRDKIIDIAFDEDQDIYAIAIDIGTTTVAMNLYNIETAACVGDHRCINAQRGIGADVISRTEYAIEHGTELLQDKIVDVIINGIKTLSKDYFVLPQHIYQVVITGNTTMLHLLTGISPESLSQVPFTTTFLEDVSFTYKELFQDEFLPHGLVTLLPGISAYVGSDITAGMLSVDMDLAEKPVVLIDIGTNGEIVIGNKDHMFCTATAAGPAFEGGNISCGVGSIAGAIAKIKEVDQGFAIETIGDAPPIGVCGTGVIDFVAQGLASGWIDDTGALVDLYEDKDILIATDKDGKDITFTQKDVREIQLAKAAIRAGLERLVDQYGCTYDDIETVYLAGGFGTYVDLNSVVNIGVIPKELKEKIKVVGNTSLSGCVEYLLSKDSKRRLEEMKKTVSILNLGADVKFNELFIDHMYF